MSSDDALSRMLAAEAKHAEATKDDPIPAEALARATWSVMFSLRLNPEELAAVQALAEAQGVPASSLVRGWIVQRLTAESTRPNDTAAMLARLESDVRVLRKLVAS